MYLTDEQLIQLRASIQRQRETILIKAREELKAESREIETRGDEVDIANQEGLLATMDRLRSRDLGLMQRLDEAQQWILDEDYGCCKECDAEIGFKRLLARPTARLCIDCKEFQEQQERGYGHPSRRRGRSNRAHDDAF